MYMLLIDLSLVVYIFLCTFRSTSCLLISLSMSMIYQNMINYIIFLASLAQP